MRFYLQAVVEGGRTPHVRQNVPEPKREREVEREGNMESDRNKYSRERDREMEGGGWVLGAEKESDAEAHKQIIKL